jgi:hypothetical protein
MFSRLSKQFERSSRLLKRRTGHKLASALAGLVLISLTVNTLAQVDTGSLTGTITDTSGAVIVGATVTLTNNDSGVPSTAQTTSTGTYVFNAVKAGTYSLQAVDTGFKAYSTPGIDIHVQQTQTINIVLEPGSASEHVTVTAATPLLQAETASVGQTVESQVVNDMPLNGRNWVSLGQISAGVTTTAGGASTDASFTVNGNSPNQNDILLNGIDDVVEQYGNNSSITPPPDAIQEFRLQTGDFSAEFGHSTGAILNATVKSGGNRLRGDLWEYVRNNIFDANDYFSNLHGIPIQEYRQNQFGGTIGGPVFLPKIYDGRNKTFWFFDYQRTSIIQPVTATSTVPTAPMIDSGYTNLQDLVTYNAGTRTDGLGRVFPIGTVFDPATTRSVAGGAIDPVSGLSNPSTSAISIRDPFFTGGIGGITNFTSYTSQLNQLPAARLDPNVIKLLGLYPSPTKAGAFANNYFQSENENTTTDQFDIRIDQTFSRDTLFGVFSYSHELTLTPGTLPGIANGQYDGSGSNPSPHHAIAFGYSHIFSATLTNDFHFGFDQNIDNNIPTEGDTLGIPAQYGIQGVPQTPGNGGLPAIAMGGLSNIGLAPYVPTLRKIITMEFSDNLTKVHGSQLFKVGYLIDSIYGDITQPAYPKGDFTYNGQFTSVPNQNPTLTGIADALLVPTTSSVGGPNYVGGVSSFMGSNYAATNDHRYYMGTYFQDDWKVTPTLTLNLGIRWDYTTPYAETSGRQANFVAANGNGPTGTYYLPNKTCNTPRSVSFNTLLAKDGITIACISGLATGNAQAANFAPRIGFAYRVTPNVVVRGGYGITYGALDNIGFATNIGVNYPFLYSVAINAPSPTSPLLLPTGQTATMENSLVGVDLVDPTALDASGLDMLGRQFNYQTPYSQTTNFTVQYQLDKHDTIQAGYIGTLGRHLDVSNLHNSPSQPAPPGANIYSYISFPDFAPNSYYETTNGSSNYNSLQTVFTREMAHGISVVANYTYSKCMTDAAEMFTSFPSYTIASPGVGVLPPNYRAPWLPGFGIAGDYTICPQDATHVVHATGTFQLPVGQNRLLLGNSGKLLDLLVGGWSFNYLYTYQSGQPFTIDCPIPTSAFFGCNANADPEQGLYRGGHSAAHWLNAAAFTNPAPLTEAGATSLAFLGGGSQQARGPAFMNLDASLFKQFKVNETTRFEFRAEAFNLANWVNFGQPGNLDFTNTTSFSQITSIRGNPRLLQLALKLYF